MSGASAPFDEQGRAEFRRHRHRLRVPGPAYPLPHSGAGPSARCQRHRMVAGRSASSGTLVWLSWAAEDAQILRAPEGVLATPLEIIR